jgi:SagB-type dehydrogenase family enzyme
VSRAFDRIDVELILSSGVVMSDYALDRPVARRPPAALPPDTEWLLTPGATCRLEEGRLTLCYDRLPDGVRHAEGAVSAARTRRTVEIDAEAATLDHLLRGLSSGMRVEGLVEGLPPARRAAARDILFDLVDWEAVVDAGGARSLRAHLWSMRGARSRGRLSEAELAELTFSRRTHDAEHGRAMALAPLRALPVDSLSTILRGRRSVTRYGGASISLDQLGQWLGHACGTTGELVLGDRKLPLRAYPSPGALYAVDVHVIPARVEGLGEGVFRYDAEAHALVTVHDRPVDPVSLALPDVRAVAGGAAAFVALSICLSRAVRKYGDESYRILVAEAGCIAQNLILVAHALALRAGPLTGLFDSLVDQAIGVDGDKSRFVLGVLIGSEAGQ